LWIPRPIAYILCLFSHNVHSSYDYLKNKLYPPTIYFYTLCTPLYNIVYFSRPTTTFSFSILARSIFYPQYAIFSSSFLLKKTASFVNFTLYIFLLFFNSLQFLFFTPSNFKIVTKSLKKSPLQFRKCLTVLSTVFKGIVKKRLWSTLYNRFYYYIIGHLICIKYICM